MAGLAKLILVKRVVVQLHEADKGRHRNHLIQMFATIWRQTGIQVNFSAKPGPVDGDLLIHHVASSRVPDSYLNVSGTFRNSINRKAQDIRKHVWMEDLLHPDSSYQGPVIVKTTLNFGGWDEVSLGLDPYTESGTKAPLFPGKTGRYLPKSWRNYLTRIGGMSFFTSHRKPYRIFSSLKKVPREVFLSGFLVVQPYLVEKHGDQNCLREWYFLGEANYYNAELGHDPIFTSGTFAPELTGPPPPEVLALRKKLNLDYGKIDYAIVDGKPVIYDANKTPGVSSPSSSEAMVMARKLSHGINQWL